MAIKRKIKHARGWVGSAQMSAALDIPATSLLRGARAGRLAARDFKKEDGGYTFHKQRVLDSWFLGVDPKHVKAPKGGKTREELIEIQDRHESAAGRIAGRSGLNLGGTSDAILDALREKLDGMTGTDVRIAKDAAAVLKAEIELAIMRNDLLRRKDVYNQLFAYGLKVRNRLEGVPVRIVDNVMACDDRVEAIKLIRDSIDEALTELTEVPEMTND